MQPPTEQVVLKDKPDLLKDALCLWDNLRELSHDHFRLAALETQRAGMSLVAMLVLGLMLAVILNAVWFGLMALLIFGLLENGVDVLSALLLAIACCLLLVLALVIAIRRKSYYLQYPAIGRSLQSSPNLVSDMENLHEAQAE
jgi:uncharacterized membrane protein YqjE